MDLSVYQELIDSEDHQTLCELIYEQWIINFPTDWAIILSDAFLDHLWFIITEIALEKIIEDRKLFYPEPHMTFNFLNFCKPEDVKVVIIGQDPYPNGEGIGMAFSLNDGEKITSSLRNIFKVINSTKSIKLKKPLGNNVNLTPWAKQGVLLMNNCLTVQPQKAGSYKNETWIFIIKNIIKLIEAYNKQCIYLLWGNNAKGLKKHLDKKAIVFESSHPSGRSAHLGFMKCNHFELVNKKLVELKKEPINWELD